MEKRNGVIDQRGSAREVGDAARVADNQRQPISGHSERHLNQSISFIGRPRAPSPHIVRPSSV